MVKGSCVCGDWKYEFDGEILFAGICHCHWCQKTSGHNGNTFAVIMDNTFKKLSGTDKIFDRAADSGNTMKSYACEKCSCIMWVRSESKPTIRMIRTGTIDDEEVLNKLKPQKELYCSFRPAVFAEYPGIAHSEKM